MIQFVQQHLALSLFALWLFSNVVGAMPSPNGTGATATWWYKWLFGTLHAIGGAVPRMIIQFFPQYAKFFGAVEVSNRSAVKNQVPVSEETLAKDAGGNAPTGG